MAESDVGSTLEFPIVPTFFHVALAKVAIPLFFRHGSSILNEVMTDIHEPTFNGNNQEAMPLNYCRAQQAFLFLPVHLRQRVVEAVNSIEVEIYKWQREHYFLEHEMTKFWNPLIPLFFNNILYWRSDGTIDQTKTAQELVRNKNISINMRFKMACKYCLKERIKTLWMEIVASGKTKNYETTDDSIENGWIEWIHAGTPADWKQAILRLGLTPRPRYSSFFSSLQPEDKTKVITFMVETGYNADDVRFCLYAMTYEERVQVLKRNAFMFLSLFVRWPLQSFFLEMAEKVKNYIDYDCFLRVLRSIMIAKRNEDFDYSILIVGFWNIHPDYYKELLKDYPEFYQELNEFLILGF